MDFWAHREDCMVERDCFDYPGKAVLMTYDGEILFMTPETWEDHQLFMTLDIANEAYLMGKQAGEREKMREIKRALEI